MLSLCLSAPGPGNGAHHTGCWGLGRHWRQAAWADRQSLGVQHDGWMMQTLYGWATMAKLCSRVSLPQAMHAVKQLSGRSKSAGGRTK